MLDNILNAIRNAGDEESKLYIEAAIQRRKELLGGGDLIYREFTKEQVDRIMEIDKKAQEIMEREEW